jgi:uncharacterized protein YaaN involved in tellurite resistance
MSATEDPSAVASQTSTAGELVPLEPPQPVAAIPHASATKLVTVDEETARTLDAKADEFVEAVSTLDVNDPVFITKMKAITGMGSDDIRNAASVSNRLLDKPARAMESGVFDSKSKVSESLVELRRTVEDLDPGNQKLFSKGGLLGKIPFFGDDIRDYFAKYQSSQSHINAVIDALLSGQDELLKDNASIEQEKVGLWDTMQRLRQYIYLAQALDTRLTARIAQVEPSDPERAKQLKEDGLFYARQKVQDLLTQLAVSTQGYMALDMIRRNNLELVKGVDRATTTTVSALRTAVIVAQALSDQKLVLDQITALNTTTGNLIESTSELLREQSGKVHEQAASSTVDVEKLQKAFQNIYIALDEIDTYKVAALDTMQKTVTALQTEVAQAQQHLERLHDGDKTAASVAAAPEIKGELAL